MQISEDMIKQICSDMIYKRGIDYIKQSRVHIRKRTDTTVIAVIDDDQLYNVQIAFTSDCVTDFFCTCPYYQTMQSPCKHIIATLKQRQAELEVGNDFVDDNDKIAADLCDGFVDAQSEKQILNIMFSMHIDTKKDVPYGVSLKIGTPEPKSLGDIEHFLDCYMSEQPFRLSKHETYTSNNYIFGETQKEILDVLSENLQNKKTTFYNKSLIQSAFGAYTAKRLFPLLTQTGFELHLNGIHYSDFRVIHENPDVLVDITAMDSEINLSVADTGVALTPDGVWFFYEGDLYETTPQWREWFMPIYNSLTQDTRTQIQFKGNNTVAFASTILPQLRDKHGVTMNGIAELIVEDTPKFEVSFDKHKNGICAAIKAIYGTHSLRIPHDTTVHTKIIVRNFKLEQEIVSHFDKFTYQDGMYIIHDNTLIYDFLELNLPNLQKLAHLYYSDAFKTIHITSDASIRAYAHYNDRLDIFDMGFESSLTYDEIRGILDAVRLNKRFYRLYDGRFLKLDSQAETSIFDLLDKIGFNDDDIKNKSKTLNRYDMLYLNIAAQKGILDTNKDFNTFINNISKIHCDIPEYLKDVLRPYQIDGINWLKQLSVLGLGGILADDMGLGKTLQVIAFVCSMSLSTPTLIVTPSTLTYNWKQEINRFSPMKSVLIVDGTKDERSKKLCTVQNYDFVITSYPLLRRDDALYESLHFDYMFIDEAQYIKNPKTMNARTIKKIHADHKFALTGTPIENSLTELWSIFDFVMHGYLYSYTEFSQRFESRIGTDDEYVLGEIRDKIKPFLLRRLKSDVLSELPEKIENTMLAELTSEQKQHYAAYLALAKNEALSIISGDTNDGGKLRILSLLMRLRQICCHPKLFDEGYKKDSGKLILLEEIVTSAIASSHRILIFSQFTSMLSIIRERFKALDIDCFYLDGSTPSQERMSLAQRFNDGENSVFLISLKAGGTGLNLTGADMVIHYDPWWNPAVMDQASDRVHRIGQKRSVQIIKLAAQGTIEEKIIKLQEKKRLLADGIIKANKAMLSKLSKDEILGLFE